MKKDSNPLAGVIPINLFKIGSFMMDSNPLAGVIQANHLESRYLHLDSNPLAGVILNNSTDRITLLADSNPLAGGNTVLVDEFPIKGAGFKPPCGGNTTRRENPVEPQTRIQTPLRG